MQHPVREETKDEDCRQSRAEDQEPHRRQELALPSGSCSHGMEDLKQTHGLVVLRKVRLTAGITCGAHIDDARGGPEHLQLQRPDWFMPLFDTVVHPRMNLRIPKGTQLPLARAYLCAKVKELSERVRRG